MSEAKFPSLTPRRIQYGYRPARKGASIESDETFDSPYKKNRRIGAGILIAIPTSFSLPPDFQRVSLQQAMKHLGREVIHDAKLDWDNGMTMYRHPELGSFREPRQRESMGRRRSSRF